MNRIQKASALTLRVYTLRSKPVKQATFFVLILIFLTQLAYSQEALTVGRSYRALAMGNTGIASAVDSAAINYNPATLANIQDTWIDYAALSFEASQGFTLTDATPLLISASFPFVNKDGISDSLKYVLLAKTNPYIRSYAGVSAAMNLDQKGFTFAGTYFIESLATMAPGDTSIFQRSDKVFKTGLSYPIGMGQIVLGVSLSRIIRKYSYQAATDTLTTWSPDYNATSYDFGLIYRMANRSKITWGVVATNVGGITYGDSGYSDPQEIHFGFSMNQDIGSIKFTPAIDIRRIGADTGKANTLHLGVELGLLPNASGGSVLTYRMGSNQGYLSHGAEINMLNHSLIFGYTQYGEEVGIGTDKVESRRSVVYLSLGF